MYITCCLSKNLQAHEAAYAFLKLIQKYYGINHPALFSALNNLALINKVISEGWLKFQMGGEYENAKLLYTKVMEGYIKFFGPKHLSTLTVMQNLANLYPKDFKSKAQDERNEGI